jgi:sugar lactone lactonase YvrE
MKTIDGIEGELLECIRYYSDLSLYSAVDIIGGKVFIWDDCGALVEHSFNMLVSFAHLLTDDELVLASDSGIYLYNPKSKCLKIKAECDSGFRFNDGLLIGDRLMIGTMSLGELKYGKANLYSVLMHSDSSWEKEPIVSNITLSNGLVYSKRNNLYLYTDTCAHSIVSFKDCDLPKNYSELTTMISFDSLVRPDGLYLDSEEYLWVAHWGQGIVTCWDYLTSKLIRTVELPHANVTSCLINNGKLFVTTASDSVKGSGRVYFLDL